MRLSKNTLFWLSIGTLVFILPVLVIMGLLFFWSMEDENLRGDAETALSQPAVLPPPDPQNAYFALLGFNVAEQKDAWDAGMDYWLKVADAIHANQPKPQLPNQLNIPSQPDCFAHPGCLQQQLYTSQISSMEMSHYQTLLNRYHALRQYPSFAIVHLDQQQNETPIPVLERIPHQFWQIALLYQFQRGDTHAALQDLVGDLHFWSMLARQSDSIIVLAQAHKAIQRDYFLLSELMAIQPAALIKETDLVSGFLEPLPPNLFNYAQVVNGEGYRIGWALRSIASQGDLANMALAQPLRDHFALKGPWGKWLFQPKKSVNLLFASLAPVAQKMRRAPRQLLYNVSPAQSVPCNMTGFGWTQQLQNWTGRQLACRNLPHFYNEALQIQKTEAIRRLVATQWAIVAAQPAPYHVPQASDPVLTVINALPSAVVNPSNQQKAHYDTKLHQLIFEWPVSASQQESLRVQLPR